MTTIEIPTLAHLDSAAARLADELRQRRATVVAFDGEMGAGKTTLISALCRRLGVADDMTASPTFAIINEYRGSMPEPIYHFDLYRIDSMEEALDLGLDDYFYSGSLCFLEWAERIEPLLPDDTLRVEIRVNSDGSRTLIFKS